MIDRTISTHSEPAAPGLRDYGRMLWRRRWIVLCVAVLAPAVAIAVSLRQDEVYEATSQVLLQNENLAATLTGVSTSLGNDPERLVQTQADLARVPLVARRTLARSKVSGLTARDFLDDSSVSPKTDSDMLEFSVRNGKPEVAQKLASVYAREYADYRRQVDTAAISRALGEAEQRLAELRESGDSNSALYASVADKVQTLQTMEALQTSNAFVVRTPDEADQVSPKPVRNGILALVLGLVLGVGLALLRETLDTRVRTAEEVSHALRLPLLGRLAQPPRRLASRRRLITLAQPRSPGAEAFRVLRMNLDFVNLDHNVRSILVTSALEGEGKSTTAANLAVVLAQAGRRVVLVDLDLRRPGAHEFFGVERGSSGVTDVALATTSLADALRRVDVDANPSTRGPADPSAANGRAKGQGSLDVLAAGPLPPDPAEFIETSSLGEILVELRERYHTVVVDSPPVLAVGDPLMLSTRVDGVLIVTRLALLRRPMLRELQRTLEMSPTRLLGFVLAAAETEETYGRPGLYGYYGSAPVPQSRELVS